MSVVGGWRDEYSRDDEQSFTKEGSNAATLSLRPHYLFLHLPGVEKAGVLIHLLGPKLPAEQVGQLSDVYMILLLVILYSANNKVIPLDVCQLDDYLLCILGLKSMRAPMFPW